MILQNNDMGCPCEESGEEYGIMCLVDNSSKICISSMLFPIFLSVIVFKFERVRCMSLLSEVKYQVHYI